MKLIQRELVLKPKPRGCHLVTDEILGALPEIADAEGGLLHLFLRHTSAALTINENADPTVRTDLEMATNRIVPENFPYEHTCEGPDDMPSHIKSSLFGVGLLVPLLRGKTALGTWQGLYLCEHRDHSGGRKVVASLLL